MNLQIVKIEDTLWIETLKRLHYDVYHLPEYVYLESLRTKTTPEAIVIKEEEKVFFVPYLLRKVNHTCRHDSPEKELLDAVSPYGYPGLLLSSSALESPKFIKAAMEQFVSQLRSKNICSAFLRLHPIINDGYEKLFPAAICQITGETISVNLKLSSEEIWRQTKPGHRNKINRCKRRQFKVEIVNFKNYLHEFREIYKETMDRLGASDDYYFNEFYFSYLAEELADKIHLAIVKSKDNEIGCAGLFTECNGIVQYHLGGTRNNHLKEAPSKLMFDYVRYWAKERGNEYLHLGGGLGGSKDDNLFRFKAGFSKQRHTYLTIRLITEEKKYLELTASQAKTLSVSPNKLLESGFFPAYRYSG